MSEKTEWELVDSPQSDRSSSAQHGSSEGKRRTPNPSAEHFLQTLLGRWWQLKLLGAGIVAALAFVLLIMIGGFIVMTLAVAAVASLGVAKLVAWLRGKQLAHSTHLSPQDRRPWQ